MVSASAPHGKRTCAWCARDRGNAGRSSVGTLGAAAVMAWEAGMVRVGAVASMSAKPGGGAWRRCARDVEWRPAALARSQRLVRGRLGDDRVAGRTIGPMGMGLAVSGAGMSP